jgi:hypothetical protein
MAGMRPVDPDQPGSPWAFREGASATVAQLESGEWVIVVRVPAPQGEPAEPTSARPDLARVK